VYYSERRASAVGTDPNGTVPWPNYERDERLDIDPGCFSFRCDSCLDTDIVPVREDLDRPRARTVKIRICRVIAQYVDVWITQPDLRSRETFVAHAAAIADREGLQWQDGELVESIDLFSILGVTNDARPQQPRHPRAGLGDASFIFTF